MKLSIIIPYYKTLEYTKKLFETLTPQLTKDVEVILIDDGCNEKKLDKLKAKVIHLKQPSGNASYPRNVGLDNAKGKYICFIDSDDIVELDYVDTILTKIDSEDFDYCYYSWQSPYHTIIISNEPPEWNCCVWNCVYKKDIIGNERFNHELKIAEDYDFNKRVKKGKRANITKVLYYYSDTPNSLFKRNCK